MFTPQEVENAELLMQMKEIGEKNRRLLSRNRDLMEENRTLKGKQHKCFFIIKVLKRKLSA